MRFHKKTVLMALALLFGALWLIFGRRGLSKDTEAARGNSKASERLATGSHVGMGGQGMQPLPDLENYSITLYGKVVDQFGDPVSNATVETFLYAGQRDWESGEKAVLKTDKDGGFSITGLKGRSLGVSAMKDGYLRVPALSSVSSGQELSYTGGSGTGDRHSIPSNPVVLELIKIDSAGAIVHVGKKRWKLPLDGTPYTIALDAEDGNGVHQIQFRFSSDWNKLPKDNKRNLKTFNWSFEVRVPGGGVAWDESDVKFEAPASGYKEVVRYDYPATKPRDEWVKWRAGRYFVKFADGTYGRIQFSIDGTSDRRPLYMESWLSLEPGSRNLATEHMIINVMESKDPGD